MKHLKHGIMVTALWALCIGVAGAASYKDTIAVFRQAGASGEFFSKSYAYVVFPTVGAGALGVGGAYGTGHVYLQDKFIGVAKLKQISVGLQVGGKAYSQIIFFEDKRALDEFESGNFEFGADASVIAVTAGAHAAAATNGVQSGSSEGQHDASTTGSYQKGMATFVVAKGGLMVSASVAGQKFDYEPLDMGPVAGSVAGSGTH